MPQQYESIPRSKIEVYLDVIGQWRWRIKAANGKIIAASEGYRNYNDAIDTAKAILDLTRTTIIEVDYAD